MTTLLWLRRDLRLHDQPALRLALQGGGGLVPVFCFDPLLFRGRHASGPRTQFLLDCLSDLDQALRRRGSGLVLRHGSPQEIIPALARELGVRRVVWSADVSPFAAKRDRAVRRELATLDLEAHALPGVFVLEDPGAPRTRAGHPYRVFTPFHRAWLRERRREVRAAPRSLPPLPESLDPGTLPTLADLQLDPGVPDALPGGEQAARRRLEHFLERGCRTYAERRDDLGADASSRLSPYLHFGCLSARELEASLPEGGGAEEFRRQLAWRDFYAHLLYHFPDNARHEFRERFRGAIDWRRDEERFAAWGAGRTGYPLVDAAMRQLRREGWMPNRARLVAGSFLTKDLGLDWRWGERWFMRWLIDGDEASNNGNWQWIASVGVDPQPPYRRIYNPARQQSRFDPDGAYVRRHVPELRRVPQEYLAEPWTMPPEVQHEAGCLIGQHYPAPIVDHAEARREALARYALAGARATS